jgi:hypothetical protein
VNANNYANSWHHASRFISAEWQLAVAPAEKEYAQEVQANITARIRAALTSSIFGLFCDNCQGRYCLNNCLLSTVSEACLLEFFSHFRHGGDAKTDV